LCIHRYSWLVRSKHVGDTLVLTVLRNGQELEVSYPLAAKDHLVPLLHGVDCQPSYFIVGKYQPNNRDHSHAALPAGPQPFVAQL
jgi:hypothetical protein